MNKKVLKGEIWYVVLDSVVGSEQGKDRYCLVIQNDKANECSNTTVICTITSIEKEYGLTHVPIDCLKRPSIIQCEQIKTIDKRRLKRRVCMLDDKTIEEVNDKLRLQLEL